MGVLRAEPARVTDWAAKSVGAAWRAFDRQMTIFAVLLAAIGLAMAYSNSVAAGDLPLDARTTFARGLMWAALAVVVFIVATAFDYNWLKTFAWPLYFVNLGLLVLTLAIGDGVGGAARWIAIGPFQFQFSELAKILMIIVLANYLAARERQARLALDDPRRVPAGRSRRWSSSCSSPTSGRRSSSPRSSPGCCSCRARACAGWPSWPPSIIALVPIAWTYILRDYQKQRLLSFLDPTRTSQGSGYQLYQAQIAVGSGGLFGKGLTNGTQTQLDFLPVQTTDFVFALLAEELGFLGAMLVFGLFFAADLADPR